MLATTKHVIQGLVCVLFVALLLIIKPSPALAHAEFRGSSPAPDALLDALPEIVSLRFSEPVGALSMEWLLPDGSRSPTTATAVPEGLELSAPPEAGRGTYVLNWRVVSADGHPIGGALVFSFGEVTGSVMPITKTTAIPAIVTRYLAVLSMVLAVGAAVFSAVIAPLPVAAARLGSASAFAALPLALAALGAYGLDLMGGGPTSLMSATPWVAAIFAPRGWGLLLGAGAALITGGSKHRRGGLALLALTLGAVSLAVSGHASSGPNRWIGQPLMALHAATLIFWVGGLPPLIVSVSLPDGLRILRRFSTIALPVVIVLVASGVGLIIIRGASIAELTQTGWGKLLALKIALVACMLGLALLNKTRLTPALSTTPGSAQTALNRSIAAEIGLGAAVLLVAMCFRLTPPPEATITPIVLHLHGADAMAEVIFSTAPPGAIEMTLHFSDDGAEPLFPKEVSLSFTDSGAGVGPIKIDATPADNGAWLAGPITLPTAGPWNVKLTLLITDFAQSRLNGTYSP